MTLRTDDEWLVVYTSFAEDSYRYYGCLVKSVAVF